MGVSGPTLVSSSFSSTEIIAVSLSLEQSWLDMLPYPLSKGPQAWSGPCRPAHLDKLRHALYDWNMRESRAPGRWYVCTVAQDEDLRRSNHQAQYLRPSPRVETSWLPGIPTAYPVPPGGPPKLPSSVRLCHNVLWAAALK